jgi:leader peptidase (prepilin peptidase)/N-methyltransferase
MAVYRYGRRNRLLSVPNKKRIDKNRSYCDYCGRQLKWWENIPIISWIMLRGKSRCCGEPLPGTYPLVELITGGLMGGYTWRLLTAHPSPILVEYLTGLIGLGVITVMVYSLTADLKYMVIPDETTMVFLVLTVGYLVVGGGYKVEIMGRILAAIGALVLFAGLHFGTKGRGMGWGDVKLVPVMGLFLNWEKTILAFYAAFIIGAVTGIVLITAQKAGRKSQIPFGPFLWLGFWISWWWGEKLISYIYLWF